MPACRHLHGAYKGGTPPFECAPLGVSLHLNGSLTAQDDINQLIVEGGAHNKAAREVFAGSDIIMTESWNATVELYEYHRELADGRGHECGESRHSHLISVDMTLPRRGQLPVALGWQ